MVSDHIFCIKFESLNLVCDATSFRVRDLWDTCCTWYSQACSIKTLHTTQIGTCATHTLINRVIHCIISTSSSWPPYLLFFVSVLQYITVGLSRHFLNSNNPLQWHFNKELCLHKNKVEFLQPVFFLSLFPHLLTRVSALSICWMSSEKPGNRKPLQMHLALWKMCGSWLESRHLVFSSTSWIHAFCSLHYTCAFFSERSTLCM